MKTQMIIKLIVLMLAVILLARAPVSAVSVAMAQQPEEPSQSVKPSIDTFYTQAQGVASAENSYDVRIACSNVVFLPLVLAPEGGNNGTLVNNSTSAGSASGNPNSRPVYADFNGDGCADLAVGVPGEDITDVAIIRNAGAVNVLYGSPGGLTDADDQLWYQGKDGVLDEAEEGDAFGSALAMGDFNGDGFTDLAVGAPFETIDGEFAAGAVSVLYGTRIAKVSWEWPRSTTASDRSWLQPTLTTMALPTWSWGFPLRTSQTSRSSRMPAQ
jgi:hypothetical protein